MPMLLQRAFPDAPDLSEEQALRRFGEQFWQRRSLHIPGAITPDPELVDGDELAGIACEEGVDARMIQGPAGGWRCRFGPFSAADFDACGDANWTLLVNAVDHHLPGFEPLLQSIHVLPDWRLDDVMVSFAAPGGSAGPHVDRYDVFLVQLEGERTWHLGPDVDGMRLATERHGDLELVAQFQPATSVRCVPGDVLYVPAGMVHHGVAQTPALTASLGFTAPDVRDLAEAWLLMADVPDARAVLELDGPLATERDPVSPLQLERLRGLLQAEMEKSVRSIPDDELAEFIGNFVTRPRRSEGFSPPPRPLDLDEFERACGRAGVLLRAPGLRTEISGHGELCRLHAGGQTLSPPLPLAEIRTFTGFLPIEVTALHSPAAWALAVEMYNAGLLEFPDDQA